MVALNTGMRRGEIFGLQWFDVNFGRALINVRNTKTGKDRLVPMNSVVRELLESLPKSSGHVFPSPRTKERLVDIKVSFEAALTAAKLSVFRFHDLRHTAATRPGSAGVDAFTLCSIFGWSDVRVAQRDPHALSKARHEAVEKLTSGDESVTKEKRQTGGSAVSS